MSGDSAEELARMPRASGLSNVKPAPMTEQVHLKLLAPDDWALYRDLHQDPETMRFIGSPFTLARCEAMFERTLAENASADGSYRIWVVRGGARGFGIASIMGVEVGVMISRESRQRGVARNIMFIEKVGSEASYACLSKSQYEAEVVDLGLRSEETRALLERDVHALVNLTGGKKVMVCMIALPEDDAGETDEAVEVTELSASRIH